MLREENNVATVSADPSGPRCDAADASRCAWMVAQGNEASKGAASGRCLEVARGSNTSAVAMMWHKTLTCG